MYICPYCGKEAKKWDRVVSAKSDAGVTPAHYLCYYLYEADEKWRAEHPELKEKAELTRKEIDNA